MSALYDGIVEESHHDGGATYRMTLRHRVNGKDYKASKDWRHNHSKDYGTRPALHHRDSMKWSLARTIDKAAEASS